MQIYTCTRVSASPAEYAVGAQVMMWQNARVIPVAKWEREHDA